MSGVDWSARVDDLLTDGERVVASEPVGENDVVVTNRRVIAFTPGTDGPNYRSVDRPNVDGVRTGRRSAGGLAWPAVLLLSGGGLAAFGVTFDLEGALTVPDLPAGVDIGISGAIETMQTALALLDDAALALGGLLALAGVALVAWWLVSRERVLVIEVAGSDDLSLPLPPDEHEAEESADTDPLDPGEDAPPEPDLTPVERVRRAILEA